MFRPHDAYKMIFEAMVAVVPADEAQRASDGALEVLLFFCSYDCVAPGSDGGGGNAQRYSKIDLFGIKNCREL